MRSSFLRLLPFLFLITACASDDEDEGILFDPDGDGPERAVTLDCRDPETWPASWVAFEDEVLAEVNVRRAAGATCGGETKPPVPALVMDAALREAARCHSLDMVSKRYFSHDSADGRSPWDRAAQANYTGFASAENIIAGYSTGADAVGGWMDSPGHCHNIMADGPSETGIGYAFIEGAEFGGHYATEMFGSQ